MSRSQFDTGQDHQRQVAVWARRRLVDSKGVFRAEPHRLSQIGVILADGVGMGKTWEALAASSLLLVEKSKHKAGGAKRQNKRRQAARVLVLCPPGLVSKWTREIRDPDGFQQRLEAWTNKQRHRRGFVYRTLTEPFEIRSRSDLPRTTKKGNRLTFPPGIYVCNWNVLRKNVGAGYTRLAALRRQKWNIVVVDEAHHREAKAAIKTLERYSTVGQMLLLTATPFQLDPRELHALFGTILEHGRGDYHKLLTRPPVAEFVSGLKAFFEGGEKPTRSTKRAAEGHLRQIIARSHVPTRGRKYYSIDGSGRARLLHPPPDRLDESQLQEVMEFLSAPSKEFEAWYLRRRMELASCKGKERTFIPNKLRRALSTVAEARASLDNRGKGPTSSPKTESLIKWARTQFTKDLRCFVEDGWPRKTLVFTSFTGKAPQELSRRLVQVIEEAWRTVARSRDWKKMASRAAAGLQWVQKKLESRLADPSLASALEDSVPGQRLVENIRSLIVSLLRQKEPTLIRDLFGRHHFAKLVFRDLDRRLDVVQAVLTAEREGQWQAVLHRDELRRLKLNLQTLRRGSLVLTYTGRDDPHNREAWGEAFRSPLGPWALVASNVGSEGIDLQNLSAHLVHFDIEWNPARMEQREGRIDRVGRLLPDHVNVHYVLIRKTYDERMLHQLVARQRWHAVLLGRPGARLAKDEHGGEEARILNAKEAAALLLDLRPGTIRKRAKS
jgi:hypothetical protein